jgi:hypothetical protein
MSQDSCHLCRRNDRFARIVRVIPFVALFAIGCGTREAESAVQPTVANLRSVRNAYFDARQALDRPPNSKEELVPYLKKFGDPAELLRSPDDGEDFVIVFGTDPMAPESYVWAYERSGRGGSRWMIRDRHIQRMANETLAKLPFPPGHKPGF